LAYDDSARLHRFRSAAQNHKLQLPESGIPVYAETELLQNQLNAAVYLEAKPWMLPSWMVLTLKGLDTKESLITEIPNNSYRNWSLVGGVGSRRYGVTDSRGLVTASLDCGSIDIWLLGKDGIIFPALMGKDDPQLKLVSTNDQLYEWDTYVESVQFTRLLYHVDKGDFEFLYSEVVLKNIALEDASISFYVCIRPMSVLGFEPIENLKLDTKTNQVFVNGHLALHAELAPSAVYMVMANDVTIPEVIQSDKTRYDYEMSSKEGLGTAILRYDITLSPAGTKHIVFSSPLQSIPGELITQIRPDKQDRDQSVGEWYNFSERRVEAIFPDEELDSVIAQAAASLAVQANSILLAEKTTDNQSLCSWSDRVRILLALIKSGGIDVANRIATNIIQTSQDSDTLLDTRVSSPILWGLLQLHGYSIQRESIQENNKYLKLLADSLVTALAIDRPIEKQRITSDETPIGEDHDAPLEHYSVLHQSMLKEFDTLVWELGALREGLIYFSLTEVGLATKIKNTIPRIQHHAQELLEEILNARWPRPQDPVMEDIDYAILDILTSIVQLRIDDFEVKHLRDLCKKVSERRLIRNLWKNPGDTDTFSSHLALRLAQFHVWDKQRDAAERLLLRALEFLSQDYLLPEFVNPRTFGGGGGDGCSILAAADMILLLSDMLVHESMGNLVFLAGIPSEWYTEKKPLVVKGINTKFGKAHIDIGLSSNQHQIEVGMDILPDEIEIHVPETVPIRMVKAYGGSIIERAVKDRSPHIKLVPLTNEVVLTYHR
jgi:hypothetical protein